jgi:hypothetical protein
MKKETRGVKEGQEEKEGIKERVEGGEREEITG